MALLLSFGPLGQVVQRRSQRRRSTEQILKKAGPSLKSPYASTAQGVATIRMPPSCLPRQCVEIMKKVF
jgi:hypothetical protein